MRNKRNPFYLINESKIEIITKTASKGGFFAFLYFCVWEHSIYNFLKIWYNRDNY